MYFCCYYFCLFHYSLHFNSCLSFLYLCEIPKLSYLHVCLTACAMQNEIRWKCTGILMLMPTHTRHHIQKYFFFHSFSFEFIIETQLHLSAECKITNQKMREEKNTNDVLGIYNFLCKST